MSFFPMQEASKFPSMDNLFLAKRKLMYGQIFKQFWMIFQLKFNKNHYQKFKNLKRKCKIYNKNSLKICWMKKLQFKKIKLFVTSKMRTLEKKWEENLH